jgi:hypothetical protein
MRRAAVVVGVLVAAAAQAQEPTPAAYGQAISKQEAIYHSKGAERPEGYIIDRSLAAYAEILPGEFTLALERLRPQDRWLDVGAGEAHAVLDYHSRRGRAEAVALSIEDRRTARWQKAASLRGDRLSYLSGRPLGEYSRRELGQFQVITDLLGGFSYTTDLTRYMERTLEVLVTGGSFYTVLQDVHSEAVDNKPHYAGYPYTTELRSPGGPEVKVCSWLRSISCVQVSCEFKDGWTPPVEVYHVRKVCGAARVPAMTTVRYREGTPPERTFRVKSLLAAPYSLR